MDIDGDGLICFDEFCCALLDWHNIQHSAIWNNLVDNIFDLFDSDNDGKLHLSDIEARMPGIKSMFHLSN